MGSLPNEIWADILEYLEPTHLLSVQRVCSRLLKVARSSSLWKAKVFERAPSAYNAASNADSLTDLLNGLSINARDAERDDVGENQHQKKSRRARAMSRWDQTGPNEKIDWYAEYISRYAPLSTEWQHHSQGNEIRSMALFNTGDRLLSAMEDGSVKIWDMQIAESGRRRFNHSISSAPGMLFTDLRATSGSSSSPRYPTVGTAIDSTTIHHDGSRAYIAVADVLNEVDLNTLSVVSQNRYAWSITAISQQSRHDLPLMVGTSFSLHMHDPRIKLQHSASGPDSKIDIVKEEQNTVFLPNYAKDWLVTKPRSHPLGLGVAMSSNRPEAWAKVDPGPQTILHRNQNEIIVAGRMPSILFYDQRSFPKLESVIHSGARLSSLSLISSPPKSASASGEATLIAAGEYSGVGSLELYELPHTRPTDREASYDFNNKESRTLSSERLSEQPVKDPQPDSPPAPPSTEASNAVNEREPYSYKNRQSSASAKLLSVTTQGARIVYSDSDGRLHYLERDGRGIARRWNINDFAYTHTTGAVVGDSVARKITTFPNETATSSSSSASSPESPRPDGDVLFWTGSDLGIVTSKTKWTGHDELVAAFEEKMHLDDSADSAGSAADLKRREADYARIMRQALEGQANERKFLARFGRIGR